MARSPFTILRFATAVVVYTAGCFVMRSDGILASILFSIGLIVFIGAKELRRPIPKSKSFVWRIPLACLITLVVLLLIIRQPVILPPPIAEKVKRISELVIPAALWGVMMWMIYRQWRLEARSTNVEGSQERDSFDRKMPVPRELVSFVPHMKRLLTPLLVLAMSSVAAWSVGQLTNLDPLLIDIMLASCAVPLLLVPIVAEVFYYRKLRRLHGCGVIVDAKVVSGRLKDLFWLKYAYKGTQYEPRMVMLDKLDKSVFTTLLDAVKSQRPVKLLVDPSKPTRYIVLPFTGTPATPDDLQA